MLGVSSTVCDAVSYETHLFNFYWNFRHVLGEPHLHRGDLVFDGFHPRFKVYSHLVDLVPTVQLEVIDLLLGPAFDGLVH